MAKITLIGFYNYDPTLFDGLILPEGIEKDLVVDEILERSNEFESLYSNPDFVKQRITMWGRKHYRTFDKWIKALGIEYDPLNNYDRYEEYTDTHVGNELTSGNRSDVAHNSSQGANDVSRSDNRFNQTMGTGSNEVSGTENGMNNKQDFSNSLANSHTEGSTKPAEQTTTKEHQVSAYDSSTYQPSEKDTEGNVVNHNGTDESDTSSHTGTEGNTREVNVNAHNETAANSQNEANVSAGAENEKANNSASDVHTGKELYNDNRVAKDENKHEAHLYGNIGVTTSQQMLEAELEVQRFNIYVQIADLFVEDFCIMIY